MQQRMMVLRATAGQLRRLGMMLVELWKRLTIVSLLGYFVWKEKNHILTNLLLEFKEDFFSRA